MKYRDLVSLTYLMYTALSTSDVAHMGEARSAYKISVGRLKARDHSEDLGVDGRIIMEWILGK